MAGEFFLGPKARFGPHRRARRHCLLFGTIKVSFTKTSAVFNLESAVLPSGSLRTPCKEEGLPGAACQGGWQGRRGVGGGWLFVVIVVGSK
jgi:hypothetical protein